MYQLRPAARCTALRPLCGRRHHPAIGRTCHHHHLRLPLPPSLQRVQATNPHTATTLRPHCAVTVHTATAANIMTDGHSKLSNSNGTAGEPATVDVRPAIAAEVHHKPSDQSPAPQSSPPAVTVAVDALLSDTYFVTFDSLGALCANNIAFYTGDESATGRRFHGAFQALADHLTTARLSADQIRRFAGQYDFDAATPGNGYRSHLLCVHACVRHALQLSSHIMQHRGSLLFRRQVYAREIESAGQLLAALCTGLQHLLTLRDWSDAGSLFPRAAHSAAELFDTAASIDQYSFYGRCLGVQYCESMQRVVRFLAVCMAGFSEAYYGRDVTGSGRLARTTASVWRSGKYLVDPELRARRIVNISQNAEVDFCKEFWSLSEGELAHALPSVLGTAVKVNVVVAIPAEPLRMEAADGAGMVDIPVPSSHLGVGVPVSARLLSASRRRGMMGNGGGVGVGAENGGPVREPSAELIVHCHGGGFVAQSSKSHEMYLRDWAVALDVPILSIDYSLAPEAPFPRAVEEVFYAYCWALRNARLLGCVERPRVVLAGDSAGANLCLTCAIRCVQAGVRVPDGIFLAYCPVRISFDPSPARLLCLMDPLLPFGFMMRCLKAYACPNATIIERNRERVEELERVRGARGVGTVQGGATAAEEAFVSVPLTTATEDLVADATADEEAAAAAAAASERSASLDGSSLWEHIENDFALQEPGPRNGEAGVDGDDDDDDDRASDTFASASLRSPSSEAGNTELMTPDGSNGESLEEDSQPITIHRPIPSVAEDNNQQNANDVAAVAVVVDASDDELVILERKPDGTSDSGTPITNGIPPLPPHIKLDECTQPAPTTRAEESIVLAAGRDALSVQNIQQKIIQVAANVTASVTSRLHSMTASAPIRECREFANVRRQLDATEARNPTEEFVFEIPRDPLLSPWWASDAVLAQMPRVHVLTVDMDPCLDDCVMFARRLKELGRPVAMDILPGLPHGFLNFVKVSKEAHAGNKVCVQRLAELLRSDDAEQQQNK